MPTKEPVASHIPDDYEQLKGSERHPSPTAKFLAPADPNEIFSVTIVLRRRPDGPPVPGFDYFAKTPLSQRRRMPQDEFAAKYGAAPQDIDKVVEFARSHNLSIVETHAARRTVVVSGTVAQMSQAFVVTLGRYQRVITGRRGEHPQIETYRGRDGFIHVPKNLAEIVVGVFGLDNRRVGKSNANPGDPPYTNPLTVQQIAQLYKFPSPGPAIAKQTIGIVALPFSGLGGYVQSDLEKCLGSAAPQVIPISVDNVTNGSIEAYTTVTALAGQSSLTFGPTPGILVKSSLRPVAGIPVYTRVMGVLPLGTSITVLLETWDDAAGGYLTTVLSADVPKNTTIYFNLEDGEITQDICISAAAAPGAKVAVYFSTDTQAGWVDLIKRAIHPDADDFPEGAGVNPPSVLSTSWGIAPGDDPDGLSYGCSHWDTGVTTGALQAMDAAFQDAAIQGLTVCAASGDMGSNSYLGRIATTPTPPTTFEGDGYAHVTYPASDPWVLSVGGTTIGQYQPTNSTSLSWVEWVWNDPAPDPDYPWGTTGGGVSDFFPLPSYQSDAGVPKSINLTITPSAPFNAVGRGVPDVAANASINSGYSGLYLGGVPLWPPGNGTSAAAPLWAGLIAVINSNMGYNVGFVNPFLYALGSSAFNPINPLCPDPSRPQLANCPADNGNNGIPGYPAGPGWDACTGWGSPNGAVLLRALQQQLAQDCCFIVDQAVFGLGAVQAALQGSSAAVFNQAFFVVVDGFTPNQLGITPVTANNPTVQPQFAGLPDGMSPVLASVQPADSSLLSSNPGASQRFTYVYNVVFANTNGFPTPPTETLPFTATATVTAPVNGNNVTVSSSAIFELNSAPDPYFAGGPGISWLSADLRVFQINAPGYWFIKSPSGQQHDTGAFLQSTGHPAADATSFIQQVLNRFNYPGFLSPSNDLFDWIPTDETASALDLLPTDSTTNNPVYNFAVARVRYNASAVNAQSVRVFFRLMPALSTSVAYDPTTNYRRWSDGVEFGQAIPLLGLDPSSPGSSSRDVITIPFFATPRIDVTQASMDSQTDPPNVRQIDANAGNEVDAYFGCWLDINQIGQYPSNLSQLPSSVPVNSPDGPFSSLQTIQTLICNAHQCLVAEIAFDLNPIPTGLSPSTSGPLAQRNLSLVDSANPGDPGSRRIPNTFTVRLTSASLAPGERPDELMIDWGNTPSGSVATIYWPAVSAAEVLQLAARMYPTHSLTTSDSHTLESPVGGITYIPIPPGSGASFAGLISVDLPFGIGKGQVFNIVVRQVTAGRKEESVKLPNWRRVLGSFQITVPVTTKDVMLAPEERLLSVLRWIQKTIPASSRWFPVFQRYVQQIAERVRGLGGNPTLILPSPNGDGQQPSQPCGERHPHETRLEFTGKVTGLRYDRFGEFEGFLLRTEQGDERCFQSREHEMEKLVDRAWVERIVISVFVHRDDPRWPASVVLRRIPLPFQR